MNSLQHKIKDIEHSIQSTKNDIFELEKELIPDDTDFVRIMNTKCQIKIREAYCRGLQHSLDILRGNNVR